jgi:septal ring factor EnvC (AmiA/AmiB activator)
MPRENKPPEPAYRTRKPTFDELVASRNELNRTGADFLKTDMATALMFSGMAMQATDDPVKRERTQRNARKAYDAILRLREKIKLSEKDAYWLQNNLYRLKSELEQLGEKF